MTPTPRLDDWMPASSTLVSERHSLRIAAPSEVVYESLWSADFGGPIANAMLGLRALPSVIARWFSGGDEAPRRSGSESALTLRRFIAGGFATLDEMPNEELVLGLTGRFWTPTGGLVPTHRETFRDGPGPGHAQATWNFLLTPVDSTTTELITETRVRVAADVRTQFLMYWTVVRPFSGLLRRLMLRNVRRHSIQELSS